jgi:hypothetical protein
MVMGRRAMIQPTRYVGKTDAELAYIIKDASEAARAMQGVDAQAELKYLDQVNDACTEKHRREQSNKGKWWNKNCR